MRTWTESLRASSHPTALVVVWPILKKPALGLNVFEKHEPVSDLPFLGESIKCVLATQLQGVLEETDFLYSFQSAFWPDCGTEIGLVTLVDDRYQELDRKSDGCTGPLRSFWYHQPWYLCGPPPCWIRAVEYCFSMAHLLPGRLVPEGSAIAVLFTFVSHAFQLLHEIAEVDHQKFWGWVSAICRWHPFLSLSIFTQVGCWGPKLVAYVSTGLDEDEQD